MNQKQTDHLRKMLLDNMPPALTPDLQDFWERISLFAITGLQRDSEVYEKQLKSFDEVEFQLTPFEVDLINVELFQSLYHFCHGALWLFEHLDEQMRESQKDFVFSIDHHIYYLGEAD